MNENTMPPGAVQFHVTHNWDGQPLPQDLTIWVSPHHTPISKQLKPDCPCSQFWMMVVDHPKLTGRYGCVCECVGKVVA